jgi:DNA primase
LHGISNSQAFKELMDMSPETPKLQIKTVPQSPIANINERNKVYKAFLHKLKLEGEHLQNLIKRGLSWQEIGQNMYKSVPQDEKKRQRICKELINEGYSLKGIPGFYKDDNWTFVDYKGFLIPVKDVQGRIQGLQVRLDLGSKRYLWFSAHDKPCGTRAYAWIGVSGVPSKTVIITEGALKADIAHYLSRFTFISVPGVNAIKGIEHVLKELGAKCVFIAFDMDMNEKVRKIVLEARKKLEEVLLKNGFDVRIKEWDGRLGKGIDDYLVVLKKRQRIV